MSQFNSAADSSGKLVMVELVSSELPSAPDKRKLGQDPLRDESLYRRMAAMRAQQRNRKAKLLRSQDLGCSDSCLLYGSTYQLWCPLFEQTCCGQPAALDVSFSKSFMLVVSAASAFCSRYSIDVASSGTLGSIAPQIDPGPNSRHGQAARVDTQEGNKGSDNKERIKQVTSNFSKKVEVKANECKGIELAEPEKEPFRESSLCSLSDQCDWTIEQALRKDRKLGYRSLGVSPSPGQSVSFVEQALSEVQRLGCHSSRNGPKSGRLRFVYGGFGGGIEFHFLSGHYNVSISCDQSTGYSWPYGIWRQHTTRTTSFSLGSKSFPRLENNCIGPGLEADIVRLILEPNHWLVLQELDNELYLPSGDLVRGSQPEGALLGGHIIHANGHTEHVLLTSRGTIAHEATAMLNRAVNCESLAIRDRLLPHPDKLRNADLRKLPTWLKDRFKKYRDIRPTGG